MTELEALPAAPPPPRQSGERANRPARSATATAEGSRPQETARNPQTSATLPASTRPSNSSEIPKFPFEEEEEQRKAEAERKRKEAARKKKEETAKRMKEEKSRKAEEEKERSRSKPRPPRPPHVSLEEPDDDYVNVQEENKLAATHGEGLQGTDNPAAQVDGGEEPDVEYANQGDDTEDHEKDVNEQPYANWQAIAQAARKWPDQNSGCV